MKAIIIAILILLAQEVFAVDEFGLEGRMESVAPDAAPPAVSKLVRKSEKGGVGDILKKLIDGQSGRLVKFSRTSP